MPFMALQGFGIGDRPALVVFVDKRLPSALTVPETATAFADIFSAFVVSLFIAPDFVVS